MTLIALAVPLIFVSVCNAVASERPNIVVFTVDDMDYTSVNALGNPVPGLTPHMDRLVAEGTTFTQAHVPSPICAPSRQSMMTALHPHANGSYGFTRVDPDVPSLTDALGRAGYFRGSIGKGGAYGAFDWDVKVDFLDDYGRNPDLYVQETIKMLEAADAAGRPYYIGINTSDPHRPFASSEQEREYIERRRRDHPEWNNPDAPEFPEICTAEEAWIIPYLPDLPIVRKELAEYYTSTRRADHILGRVMALLEERGELDDTLFVFFSDHAAPFPLGKNNVYHHSTRTPLVFRWPGRIEAGRRVDEVVNTLDLMPTLIDLIGGEHPERSDGASLWPVLEGKAEREQTMVTTNFNQPGNVVFPTRAVHTKTHSYIVNFWPDGRRKNTENMTGLTMAAIERAAQDDPRLAKLAEFIRYRRANGEFVKEELYDLKVDPWSRNNVAGDSAYAEMLADMRARLRGEMEASNDPLLPHLDDFSYPAWWDDKREMQRRGMKAIH